MCECDRHVKCVQQARITLTRYIVSLTGVSTLRIGGKLSNVSNTWWSEQSDIHTSERWIKTSNFEWNFKKTTRCNHLVSCEHYEHQTPEVKTGVGRSGGALKQMGGRGWAPDDTSNARSRWANIIFRRNCSPSNCSLIFRWLRVVTPLLCCVKMCQNKTTNLTTRFLDTNRPVTLECAATWRNYFPSQVINVCPNCGALKIIRHKYHCD